MRILFGVDHYLMWINIGYMTQASNMTLFLESIIHYNVIHILTHICWTSAIICSTVFVKDTSVIEFISDWSALFGNSLILHGLFIFFDSLFNSLILSNDWLAVDFWVFLLKWHSYCVMLVQATKVRFLLSLWTELRLKMVDIGKTVGIWLRLVCSLA